MSVFGWYIRQTSCSTPLLLPSSGCSPQPRLARACKIGVLALSNSSPDFSEDGTSYLSKIMWSSCKSLYFTSKRFVKCSAKSLQFLIYSGLSSDWTSAIPSTIATLNPAVISCVSVLEPPAFSRICIRALLQEQCNMVPSRANKDLGTTVNSYKPTASWMSISGRLLHTIAKRANRFLSSFNSMIVSLALT